MKSIFDEVSLKCSKITTKAYSTSFTLGILFLNKRLRRPIYSIYGFVRLADEIVDSFHDYDKTSLFETFRHSTDEALQYKISLNPILNSFQAAVHRYQIRKEWIYTFLDSMEMDLHKHRYSEEEYKKYIFGSAEAVGLMCLHVFSEGDDKLFEHLKPYAMKLGAAFQKVNFLRDLQADNNELGRTYFPGLNLREFSQEQKRELERDIEHDLSEAMKGIKLLPASSRNGVYLAYYYFAVLLKKIKQTPAHQLLTRRVRIPNFQKLLLMIRSNVRHQLNLF